VVCRQQGYAGGQAYRHYTPISGPFWIGDVRCNGNEDTLLDCQLPGRGGGVKCPVKMYTSYRTVSGVAGVLCWPANIGKL
jgi:hypothetical protein